MRGVAGLEKPALDRVVSTGAAELAEEAGAAPGVRFFSVMPPIVCVRDCAVDSDESLWVFEPLVESGV